MRKYLIILLTCIIFSKNSDAQSDQFFKPFKVDIGTGFAVQSSGAGLLLYIEPSYTIAGRFKPGLKLELASLNMKNIGSTAFTFDYYFTSKPGIRVFAGGGFSNYNSSSSGGCDPGPSTTHLISSSKSAGALVRMGFEMLHFRLALEYNFVPSTYVSAVGINDQVGSTVIYKNSYLGFTAGLSIGGGKKKKLNNPE